MNFSRVDSDDSVFRSVLHFDWFVSTVSIQNYFARVLHLTRSIFRMDCEKTVGVLGGGQLGRMMGFAAHRLGLKLIPLDPLGPLSPAGLVCHDSMTGKNKF